MSFRNTFTENLILPLSDLVLGQSVSKHLKFLKKSQWWSREQIDKYQNDKLCQLIQHAYKNVPYYKELFRKIRLKPDDIQTKDDLHKIPITTKNDLKKYQGKHKALNISQNELLYRGSSGSTGEPFQFYKTKCSESFNHATAIRAWQWMGYKLGDKYVKISMNPRSSIMKRIQDKVNNCLYLSANQLTSKEFDYIQKAIMKFDPLFIRAYPVPFYYLAINIKATGGYRQQALKGLNTTGSTLHQKVRVEIEDIFQVSIFDSYSCEGGANFSQCPSKLFYHPAEEYAISEFIEDSFTSTNEEHPVRHITTDLHNYASPFIRYDTQDYVILADQKSCTCGREYINVKKILGRDSDILITPSGKYLIVENFVAYFEWINEVEQIQVVQKRKNEITINMIVNKDFTRKVYDKILNYWKDYIGTDVNVKIKLVDEIQLTPTGKRRTVIRNPEILIDEH
jgi:phenylacetate-coenzyme A ligase PaaK-like adenylate-forming protein